MTKAEKAQSVLDAFHDETTLVGARIWPFPASKLSLSTLTVAGIKAVVSRGRGGLGDDWELIGLSWLRHCHAPMVTVRRFFAPVHPAFPRRADCTFRVCSVCGAVRG